MNKLKGITTGTYLTKTLKNSKNKGHLSKEICNKCKFKDECKYKNITKFENEKIFNNNVECEFFYFSITPKAIVTTGRDTITFFSTGMRIGEALVFGTKKELGVRNPPNPVIDLTSSINLN